MDRRIHGETSRWTEKQINRQQQQRQTCEQTQGATNKWQTYKLKDKLKDKQTYGQTNRWADKLTEKQRDRQTDRWTDKEIVGLKIGHMVKWIKYVQSNQVLSKCHNFNSSLHGKQ